jgi:hypothetical protein
MSLYYRISDPSDVRDIGDQMAAWLASGNGKANNWALQPESPGPDFVWQNGAWEQVPEPTYNAEQIIAEHFSPYQLAALQELRIALTLAQKPLGPKMIACKEWLEFIMLDWSINPIKSTRDRFGSPAVSFEEATAEAIADLQS